MPPTKRKRRSKHRGTAAGTIETRGRTGRRPTAEEKKKEDRAQARERRLSTPPTWINSSKRAAIDAALMFAFELVVSKGQALAAAAFAVLAFGLYVGLGYYMDLYLYRRRMRKKETGK
jgi:hypothetical protein